MSKTFVIIGRSRPENAINQRLAARLFCLLEWREFESSLSLDRPPLGFGHPRLSGTVSAISRDKQKDHRWGGLSVCWWRRREFESSLRSTDLRFASATRTLQARVQLSRPLKRKRATLRMTLSRFWWRRRELNPRPPVLCLWLYMLSFR